MSPFKLNTNVDFVGFLLSRIKEKGRFLFVAIYIQFYVYFYLCVYFICILEDFVGKK